MKRNKFFMLGIVTVLVAVLSLTFVSNTFAKYTSTVTGEDTARVAKWGFELNDAAISLNNTTGTTTVNLFNTVLDTKDGSQETDIAVSDGSIIAPGTKGSVQLKIDNVSEVDAEYAIILTCVNAGVPLQFSWNGTDWTSDITTLNIEASNATELVHTDGTVTKTLYWMWSYEGDDTVDTNLGIAGSAEPSVTVKIVFTQVD